MSQITMVYASVWRALTRLCTEAEWPTPPVGDQNVKTFMGTFGKSGEPVECVLVVTESRAGGSQQEMATTGLWRDEYFTTEVQLKTALRNRSVDEALDRLEQLTSVFEQIILKATMPGHQPAEVGARPWWWEIAGTDTIVWPLPDGGVGGAARFTIAVKARIGGRCQ